MFFKRKYKKKKRSIRTFLPRPGFSLGEEAVQGIWSLGLLLGIFVLMFSFLGKAGGVGIRIDLVLATLLGAAKWSLPLVLVATLVSLGADKGKRFDSANLLGFMLFGVSLPGYLYFFGLEERGGLIGRLAAEPLIASVGPLVAALVLLSGLLAALLLVLDTSLSRLLGEESEVYTILSGVLALTAKPFTAGLSRSRGASTSSEDGDREGENDEETDEEEPETDINGGVKEYEVDEETDERSADDKNKNKAKKKREKQESFLPDETGGCVGLGKCGVSINYPLELLKTRPKKPVSGNIKKNQEIIRQTLADFGVSVTMGGVRVGPSVTQYSFKPAKGIPVSRVKMLTDDLAMNLSVPSLRLEAPIPGKPMVGLEIPNKTKVMVTLRELVGSREFGERKTNTLLALGRDVEGRIWTDDLKKLPHLLVAGATNSGKSVFLHSLITSLLYQNDPDDLKMILIDIKQVELNAYNGLPYLIAPVVTDDKRALRALAWCVREMERRLGVLSEAGCQNIAEYNKKNVRMPYLVVVVDELGDLLSTSKRDTEAAIIRLGQKARAAGIHLVLATQRPSVDILSPLIKANMPGRVSFQVTSGGNSKTILDHYGAENLLGQGDMLYVNSSLAKPVRLQGAYIDKSEVKAVVEYAKQVAGKANYNEDVTEPGHRQLDMDTGDDIDDTLLDEAKDMILKYKKASASMLQSRLSIGYPRANRILDILEREGVVGPSIQNKPREVMLDSQ